MSDEPHNDRPHLTCPTGKLPYTSVAAAHKHARSKTGQRMRTYRCPECHYIHLTTKPSNGGRRFKL